jgi:excisionase family DNA binding protein
MPNADGRRDLPRRRNSGSPTSENSENANFFLELRYPPIELSGAPAEELGGYPAYRTPLHKAYPRLFDLRHIEPIAGGDGFGLGIVFGDRLFDQTQRFASCAEAVQGGQSHPAPPALILIADGSTLGVVVGQLDQSVAQPFFLSYSGSGEVIQPLARCQRTPIRAKVARMVSPLTCLWVRSSSKLAWAAICKVHRLLSLPKIDVSLVKYTKMPVNNQDSLKQLKEALQAHHQALEILESTLVEFEQSISEEVTVRPQQEGEHRGVQLLSIPQLCQELGMGKSWLYRRLRSGEIPSIRLGRSIKVRRDELEQYLERHHYPPRREAQEE